MSGSIKETRVSKNTDHFKLGVSIYMSLLNYDLVTVSALGNDAIAVMNRGLIAANMIAKENNAKLAFSPKYSEITDDLGEKKCVLTWEIEKRGVE